MNIDQFKNKIEELSKLNNISFTQEQIRKLYKYMQLLLEWNQKMNLTAIIEVEEIILKHFIDSAIVNKYIKKGKTLADIGTGAGFPGLVLKIVNEDLDITLLDALNKRITFLNEVINENELKNIVALHGRAEELGRDVEHREKYDIVISRAVANMNVLLEYMLPLVKVGGKCICMKSVNAEEELENAKNVITLLGGEIEQIEKIYLYDKNDNALERVLIIIKKVCFTENSYPRKYNKINKNPLK